MFFSIVGGALGFGVSAWVFLGQLNDFSALTFEGRIVVAVCTVVGAGLGFFLDVLASGSES